MFNKAKINSNNKNNSRLTSNKVTAVGGGSASFEVLLTSDSNSEN